MNVHIDNKPDFCDCLLHPFQNDPGVSQHQRVMEELLSGKTKIDARTTADLLYFFYQLSRQINYYHLDLSVSDWKPFFEKSVPFILANMIRYDHKLIQKKFEYFNFSFNKHPSAAGLQLIQLFIFYNTVKPISNWLGQVKGTELPVERVIENLIRDRIRPALLRFISLNRLAANRFRVKAIPFQGLFQSNSVELISEGDLQQQFKAESDQLVYENECDLLKLLYKKTDGLFTSFFEPIKLLARSAELSLEQSFIPLKEEQQKKHPPHLALLFAFIKLFQQFQGDLNGFTRKHLDFFYQDVLKLKPKAATPDKAHIVFSIQKELEKYLLQKGLLVRDGKDINKEDILFALDDEIVVNQAQVKDTRTLYLHNQIVPDANAASKGSSLLEGVYMAPDATKADGVDKDFQTEVKNFYTVGNKESKYILPGTNVYKPYPSARLGFILASPVLLLNEGTRKVTITLQCVIDRNVCQEQTITKPNTCCQPTEEQPLTGSAKLFYYPFLPVEDLFWNKSKISQPEIDYSMVDNEMKKEYYYVSEELIAAAVKIGLSSDVAKTLREFLITSNRRSPETERKPYCYCPVEKIVFDTTVPADDFEPVVDVTNDLVKEFFKKRKPFRLSFSGAKEWIEPSELPETTFNISQGATNDEFTFEIIATLNPDKDAVTFYDKEQLKEDLDTELPLVKIELDDHYKIEYETETEQSECCLEKPPAKNFMAPLYHFFRHVRIGKASNIQVDVCGIKNMVVQNDESTMDVNGPVYPFGTRPDVPDFSVLTPTPATPNLSGPNFYIGSNEIMRKKWDNILINIKWKDKPNNFNDYYKAYYVDPNDNTKFGLNQDGFEINLAVLEKGEWQFETLHPDPFALPPPLINAVFTKQNPKTTTNNRPLFRDDKDFLTCRPVDATIQTIYLDNSFFLLTQESSVRKEKLEKFDVNTHDGFIRINLQNQDFLHKDYAFVLARQMIAFGKLPNDHVENAVYYDSTIPNGGPIVISSTAILNAIRDSGPVARRVNLDVTDIDNNAGNNPDDIVSPQSDQIRSDLRDDNTPAQGDLSLKDGAEKLDVLLNGDGTPGNPGAINKLEQLKQYAAIIPNEPWTPVIAGIVLDYSATADVKDMDIIHLYPFQDTYKHEEIEQGPTLFPTFCDEGTLYLGLEKLIPGSNLNILFQLAEATADSEEEKETVYWHYLDNNVWRLLRKGFEVLEDGTQNLTNSGIIKFALPENMTKDNTIMPKDLHWIKATIPKNSRSVSETTGIFTQAMRATFTNGDLNDKSRLAKPIEAGQISKLETADASVKQVLQPYDTFGGQVPEEEQLFYVRVSELLKHKGRAIQKFDYERIVLNGFPEIYKAKCINHSFGFNAHRFKNDFPYAPGYIIMAVIPDLNKLKAGNAYEPKAPVSLLEKIDTYVKQRTSPFVRFRAMNPRYEKIYLCLKVKLKRGKDEGYYKEKLITDIRNFLAPWAVGDYYHFKLTFGQCVNRSSIIGFMEALDYIDFIMEMNMRHEKDENYSDAEQTEICPQTPRSILIAGDIDLCVDSVTCDTWNPDDPCKNEPERLVRCKQPPLGDTTYA